jgi:N-acetylglucosaminyldiphosphoundecaprenol N-acetyl-beta-D-mannosaminyltransferase
VDDVTWSDTLDWVACFVEQNSPHLIVTLNPEILMKARTEPDFHAIVGAAALVLPDGIGLLWAARILGQQLRERVTGSGLVPRLSTLAAERGWRVFYLGAAPGVAEEAAARLAADNPGLMVAGTYAGSPDPGEDDTLVARVRAAAPQVLFVAYGAPRQERWIARNAERLGVPVMVGVGGALDFVAGASKRAPVWVRRLGLEWLHRLLREPWRWRRQLALWRFAALVWYQWLARAGKRKTGQRADDVDSSPGATP